MHIHGDRTNFNPINPYAAASERAVAAQKSAATRKKLAKSATGIDSSTAALSLGNWMGGQNPREQESEHRGKTRPE